MTEFDRFWSSVDIRDQRECWNWLGTLDRFGYGTPDAGIQIAFHEPFAHRVACALMHVKPFDDAEALHSCDNPSCCNPRHLRWGAIAENNEDREIAVWARAALAARANGSPVPVLARIQADPKAPAVLRRGLRRLNADVVRAIRAAFESGVPVREIAAEYGLTQSHADSVAKRQIWRHVA
jgi:hypothetical protein